jgi:iron(III) transport system permease protein
LSKPLFTAALLALLALGVAPLAMMLVRMAGDPTAFDELLEPRTLALLERTLVLGGGTAAVALALGVPYGFLTARTDMPLAGLLRPLGLLPLLMPPLILAMTWTVLVDVRGAPMTTAMLGFGTFPIVALFTARAAERIDGRREEAAMLAGGLRAVLRMQAPLLAPPIACGACFAFLFAINDFAVPDYVSSVGRKFNVYADEVFAVWQIDNRDAQAVATALPLIGLTLLALLPALFLRHRGALGATVDGRFQRPQPLALGRLRWPALAFCLLVLGAAALVPIGRLFFEAGGGVSRAGWSLERLRAAFGLALEQTRGELSNSIVYAVAAATLCVPLALVLGHALARARRGAWLTPLVILPIAMPSILFGIGTIVVWNRGLGGLGWARDFYASGGLVVIMLVGRLVAFPALVCSGAVASLDGELEEAAELAGAGPAARLRSVVAPALAPSLVGSWTLVFVLAMRELDAAILVPAAKGTVMFRIFNAVHFGRDDFVAAMVLLTLFVIVLPGLLWTLFARRRLEVLP